MRANSGFMVYSGDTDTCTTNIGSVMRNGGMRRRWRHACGSPCCVQMVLTSRAYLFVRISASYEIGVHKRNYTIINAQCMVVAASRQPLLLLDGAAACVLSIKSIHAWIIIACNFEWFEFDIGCGYGWKPPLRHITKLPMISRYSAAAAHPEINITMVKYPQNATQSLRAILIMRYATDGYIYMSCIDRNYTDGR